MSDQPFVIGEKEGNDDTPDHADLRFVHRSYHLSPGSPSFTEGDDVAYTQGDTTYRSVDLQFTEGVEDTKEIREVASDLRTAIECLDYIQKNVEYRPYFGLMKGAHETLLQGQGNDADQAALLIALLREKGIPARFVTGTLELPIEMAENWVGLNKSDTTFDMFYQNGIPSELVGDKLTIDHVWSEAFVSGSWEMMDPSFVQYKYTEPKVTLESMQFPLENLVYSFIDNITIDSHSISFPEPDDEFLFENISMDQWNQTGNALKEFFETTLGDQWNGKVEDFPPYLVDISNSIYGKKDPIIDNNWTSKVSWTPREERSSFPSDLLFHTVFKIGSMTLNLSLSEVMGKRVTISYEIGASEEGCLPIVMIDGAVKAVGDVAQIGTKQDLTVDIIGPSSFITRETIEVMVGSYYAICIDSGVLPTSHLLERYERVRTTKSLLSRGCKDIQVDETLGELLYLIGSCYFYLSDDQYQSIAAQTGIQYVSMPSMLIVRSPLESYSKDSFRYKGIEMDLRFELLNSFSVDGNSSLAIDFLINTGMLMSKLETEAFNRVVESNTISVQNIFNLAEEMGIPLISISRFNAGSLDEINISRSDREMIIPYIDAGLTVITPHSSVLINNWSGAGFYIVDYENGSVTALLSGGTSDPVSNMLIAIYGGDTGQAWQNFLFDLAKWVWPPATWAKVIWESAWIWVQNPCSFYANLIKTLTVVVQKLVEMLFDKLVTEKVFKLLKDKMYNTLLEKMFDTSNPSYRVKIFDEIFNNPLIKDKMEQFLSKIMSKDDYSRAEALHSSEAILFAASLFTETFFKNMGMTALSNFFKRMTKVLTTFLEQLKGLRESIFKWAEEHYPPTHKRCKPYLVANPNPIDLGYVGKDTKTFDTFMIWDKTSGWTPEMDITSPYYHRDIRWKVSDSRIGKLESTHQATVDSYAEITGMESDFKKAPEGVEKIENSGWLTLKGTSGTINSNNRFELVEVTCDIGKFVEQHGWDERANVWGDRWEYKTDLFITYTGEYEGLPLMDQLFNPSGQPTLYHFIWYERMELVFRFKTIQTGISPRTLVFYLDKDHMNEEKTIRVKHGGESGTPTLEVPHPKIRPMVLGRYGSAITWTNAHYLDPGQELKVSVRASVSKLPEKGIVTHTGTIDIRINYQFKPNHFKYLRTEKAQIVLMIKAVKPDDDDDPDPPWPPDHPGGTHPDDAETSPQLLLRDPEDNFDDVLRNAIRKDGPNSRMLFRYTNYFDQLRAISDPIAERDRIIMITSSMSTLYTRMAQNRTGLLTELNRAPDIMLFKNGFHEPMSDLLTTYREPFVYVTPENFDHMIIEDFKVLIVPSGGFYGLSTSEAFKEKLKLYAEAGGTILSFSQLSGSELSVLPGDIGGFGYGEDQNCFYSAVYMQSFTPALSGQTTTTPTVNVDGYFSLYPDNSTVMLRRTKNGMPALLSYPYGKGKIVASTLFSDWAYGAGGASSEEIAFVKDLIYWSVRDVDQSVGTGDRIEFSFEVTNEGSLYGSPKTVGTDLAIALVGPDRTIREFINETVEILPGNSINHTFSHSALNDPGIWTIEYILMGKGGILLGDGFDTRRISVSKYAENPNGFTYTGGELLFWVESDTERAAKGSKVLLRAFVRNNGDTEFKGNLAYGGHEARYEGGRFWAYYGAVTDITVRPGQIGVFPVTWTIDKSTSFYFGLYEKGQDWERLAKNTIMSESKVTTEKGIWVYEPSLSVEISSDNEYYKEGEQVSLSVHLKNLRQSTTLGTLPVTVKDPDNRIVFNKVEQINISSEGSKDMWVNFTLPEDSTQGFYSASADFFDLAGSRAGRGSCYFELPKDYSVSLVFGNGNGIYRIREDMGFEVRIRSYSENAINSVVNVSVPDCNLTKTMNMVLDPDEVEKYPFSVKIPTNLTPKRYMITVQVAWGDFAKDYIYSIPVSKLEVTIAGDTIRKSGDRIDLSIKNIGGVDTGITSTARLLDPRYFVVAKERIMDFLLAGEEKSFSITIPSAAATDQYLFIVRAFDNTTNWEARQDKAISVSGSSATVSVSTDSLSYPRTAVISANAEGVNGPIALNGASLAFEAYETNKGIPMSYNNQWGHREGEMSYPTGVAVDGQGRVYVVDSLATGGEERMIVKVFDPWGGLISSFASDRQDPGSLQFPHSIALDEERGLIYLTNRDHITVYHQDNWTYAGDIFVPGHNFGGNLRDLAYGGNGTLYATAGWGAGNMVYRFSTNGTLIKGWGTFYNGPGAGPGQFNEPYGIDVSNNGSWIYVADHGNHRVQVFDTNGTYLFSFGGFGTNESLFNLTLGIAIDEEGSVYVSDLQNCRIQVFNATGGFQYSFGSKGYADGAMNHPYYLAVHGDLLYVADYHNHRVQRFDLIGTFQAAWGGPDLTRPTGISYDRFGNIYVLEDRNNRVLKYDNDGNFIKEWTLPNPGYWYGEDYDIEVDRTNDWVYVSNHSPDPLTARYWILKFDLNGTYLNVWYSEGHEVAVDTEGYVYSISHHGTLFKYNSTGSLVQEMPGINGNGLAVDKEGFIYIAYRGYDFGVIDVFDSVGKLVRRYDTAFKYGPHEIHVDDRGNIYFSDVKAGKVVKMYRNGTYAWESSMTGYTEGLAVDDYGNIFVGSSIWQYGPSFYNSTIYKYEQPGYSPIWSEKSTIDVASGGGFSADSKVDPIEIGTEGKYWMRGVLRSSLGQVLSWDETPFFLADGNISLTMVTNRRGYLLNEPIEIDCVVWNYASSSRVSRVVIWKDSLEVLNRTYTVPALGSVRSLVTIEANASFLLKGLVTVEGTRGVPIDSMTTLEYIPVGPPTIDAQIEAPDYVGMGPFTVSLRIRNAWQEPVDLHVSFLSSERDIHLGPEQVTVITVETSLTTDTVITAMITGDAVLSVSRYIRLAEKVHVTVASQMFDHDGEIEVPYSIENVHNRDCRFQVRFVIGDQTIVKDHFLSAFASSSESLTLTLVAGIHILNFSTPMQEGSVVLNVATADLIVTECSPQTLGAGMDSSIFFRVSNQGPVDGDGKFTVVIPGVYQETRVIHCASGSTIEVWFNFTLPDDLPSTTVGIEYSIDGRNGGLKTAYMVGHSIEVTPVLDKDRYLDGEIVKLNVSVRYNALGSNYTLRVQFGDFENTTVFHLESYGSAFFLFDIPVVLTGEKLFVSVNLPSGRSLYINYIDVREKKENMGVLVTLDSKFNTGSMMNINVTTLREGLVNLTTPWGYWSGIVTGTKFVQMQIPTYVVSGTYEVDYRFGDMVGSAPFYVSGCEAMILGAEIAGDRKIGGEFSASIRVWSNRYADYEVRSSLMAPDGGTDPNMPLVISMVPGMNTIQIADMTSDRSGTHVLSVDVLLINETGVRSGSVSSTHRIDIAGPCILSMRTDRTTYTADDELVLTLYVDEPSGAVLSILMDGSEVAYAGKLDERCEITVGLSGLKERMHEVRAVIKMGSGEEVSEAFYNFDLISPYQSLNSAPYAINVSASSYKVNKGEKVAFSAAFDDIDGDQLVIGWDFGDGSNASGPEVVHSFRRSGSYLVTVTAVDTEGHASSSRLMIVVEGEKEGVTVWIAILLVILFLLLLVLLFGTAVLIISRRSMHGDTVQEE